MATCIISRAVRKIFDDYTIFNSRTLMIHAYKSQHSIKTVKRAQRMSGTYRTGRICTSYFKGTVHRDGSS